MAKESNKHKRPFQQIFPEEAWEHAHAAREAWCKSVAGLFPPAFLEHRRAARKEMLLAFRSVIDAALERVESQEQ